MLERRRPAASDDQGAWDGDGGLRGLRSRYRRAVPRERGPSSAVDGRRPMAIRTTWRSSPGRRSARSPMRTSPRRRPRSASMIGAALHGRARRGPRRGAGGGPRPARRRRARRGVAQRHLPAGDARARRLRRDLKDDVALRRAPELGNPRGAQRCVSRRPDRARAGEAHPAPLDSPVRREPRGRRSRHARVRRSLCERDRARVRAGRAPRSSSRPAPLTASSRLSSVITDNGVSSGARIAAAVSRSSRHRMDEVEIARPNAGRKS